MGTGPAIIAERYHFRGTTSVQQKQRRQQQRLRSSVVL